MNPGAVLVSEALLGLDFRIIILEGKPLKVSPPTIRTICCAIREFGEINVPQSGIAVELLASTPDIAERLTRGLACFFDDESAALELLERCTPSRLFAIAQEIISLISPDDFFACAALAQNVARMAATPRQ